METKKEPEVQESNAKWAIVIPKPTSNGMYDCTIANYGDQSNTTQEVRFYSERCGWLTGKTEVVIEYKSKK